MGSAAQPRNGTAPNAPAANAALSMNSRRLCRVDKVLGELLPAESLRAFVMRFPPLPLLPALVPFVAEPLIFADGNRIQYCLQYRAQFYRWAAVKVASHWRHGGQKTTQAHYGSSAEIAPDGGATAARTS